MQNRLMPRQFPLLGVPIAHRGLHDEHTPENSLMAFEKAIDLGFPIELDLRILADGHVAVFHDANTLRMGGQDHSLARLKASTARQIRLKGTSQTIPLFEEVLEKVDGKVPLLVELKSPKGQFGRLEQAAISLLRSYHGTFAVQSFSFASVFWFRQNAPDFCRGQLWAGGSSIPFTQLTQPDFVACNIAALPLERPLEPDIPLLAWTIRNKEQQEKALRYADNYIFDTGTDFAPSPPQRR